MKENNYKQPNPKETDQVVSPSVRPKGPEEIQAGLQKLITRKEVAEYLKVSIQSVINYTNRGLLTAYKIGHHIRYNEAEVIAAVQNSAVNHEPIRNHSLLNQNEND